MMIRNRSRGICCRRCRHCHHRRCLPGCTVYRRSWRIPSPAHWKLSWSCSLICYPGSFHQVCHRSHCYRTRYPGNQSSSRCSWKGRLLLVPCGCIRSCWHQRWQESSSDRPCPTCRWLGQFHKIACHPCQQSCRNHREWCRASLGCCPCLCQCACHVCLAAHPGL